MTLHHLRSHPPASSRVGRFHAHLTVECADLAAFAAFCPRIAAKATVVDLQRADRTQRDAMATRYFVDEAPGAVARIASTLSSAGEALEAAGFPVLRVKLEHEGGSADAEYDAARYHEVHVKLAIPAASFDAVRPRLDGLFPGAVPSRNPAERTAEVVHQFVNLRCREGGRADADRTVAALLAAIAPLGVHVAETRREDVVFDTATGLDRWWA